MTSVIVNILLKELFSNFVDHRICVWNAVDGSLVHSLTGHTDAVSRYF